MTKMTQIYAEGWNADDADDAEVMIIFFFLISATIRQIRVIRVQSSKKSATIRQIRVIRVPSPKNRDDHLFVKTFLLNSGFLPKFNNKPTSI